MKIKFATWNVNSVCVRIVRLLEWLKESKPDIVVLQELKCIADRFPYLEIESLGYNIAVNGQKTYNGVAILSKFPLEDIVKQLPMYGEKGNDNEARYIEAVVDLGKQTIRVASIYVPNGGSELKPGEKLEDSPKFIHKIAFYERLRKKFQELLKYNELGLFGGDFNTCPELIDMYNPKQDGEICRNINERKKIREYIDMGLSDTFRILHPKIQQFSWWGFRSKGWETGRGMRLDYILSTPLATDKLVSCKVEEKERDKERPSDHAPVSCTLAIDN
jgi:exodeoxyribonuclease III